MTIKKLIKELQALQAKFGDKIVVTAWQHEEEERILPVSALWMNDKNTEILI